MAVPRHRGPFWPAQAERLLWRAGFGPRKGEAARLRAGRFTLWCTFADHRARGMHATLVVRGQASA